MSQLATIQGGTCGVTCALLHLLPTPIAMAAPHVVVVLTWRTRDVNCTVLVVVSIHIDVAKVNKDA